MGFAVGKPERKRPLGRTTCKLEDNIKVDLKETEWVRLDGISLPMNRDKGARCHHSNNP